MIEQLQDKQIQCVDCGKDFTFSAKEQEFYQSKGFSQPKRCKPCRDKRKARQGQ
ncbi:MAG: zinc-ribbon domain-containing protein [Acidobacteria bacterium]|nr:zinc-ribbon domain-containing protein [Acidobacteriota bacterium]